MYYAKIKKVYHYLRSRPDLLTASALSSQTASAADFSSPEPQQEIRDEGRDYRIALQNKENEGRDYRIALHNKGMDEEIHPEFRGEHRKERHKEYRDSEKRAPRHYKNNEKRHHDGFKRDENKKHDPYRDYEKRHHVKDKDAKYHQKKDHHERKDDHRRINRENPDVRE